MGESLNWSFSIQMAGGPTLSGAGDMGIGVDTYVKSTVKVPANGTADVELLTGAGADMKLLVIKPDKNSDKLTFEAGGNDVPLDGPLVLIGAGAASLYGKVGTVKFKNGGGEDIAVSILAARDATA